MVNYSPFTLITFILGKKVARVTPCLTSESSEIDLTFVKLNLDLLKRLCRPDKSKGNSKRPDMSQTQIGATFNNLAPILARDNPGVLAFNKINELMNIVDSAFPQQQDGECKHSSSNSTVEESKKGGIELAHDGNI